ncbi:YebB family permuted papain-like enzyme [Paraburkholderia sp. J76]|uniref:YebB family permuted papain-like enzyme n=1 Tax=Paraburkholderia sp. J76 TaxID=2805439 RepID=UPI002ABE34D4|nr:YebB family permuted papain-like enzyme [Paraburkholderia sp. J76]
MRTPAIAVATTPPTPLARLLMPGDLLFIRVPARPFLEVAAATRSWTNHVGVVVETGRGEPLVAESTFPLARFTPLSRFVGRSVNRDVVAARMACAPRADQAHRLRAAAARRTGVLYDTGFNLHSRRQFCSRFVREVFDEALDIELGVVQTFEQLYACNADADLRFWNAWFLGRIPWARETVTPASLLESPLVELIFDKRTLRG